MLALTCGYAPQERARRLLGVYVFHGDDSGKGGPFFVVGGLVAKIENWIALESVWQAILDEPPKIDYFKFIDAFNCRNQFRQLTTTGRNRRVKKFIQAINDHCHFADASITDVEAHKTVLRGKVSASVDQPFIAGYTQVMVTTTLYLTGDGVRDEVDFIFDEMDDTTLLEIRNAHRLMKNSGHKEIAGRLGQLPITRDDKKTVALQAADLWAGLVRQVEEDALAKRVTIARHWLGQFKIPHNTMANNEIELSKVLSGTEKMMKQHNFQYETGKDRSKRLAPARKSLRSE